MLQIQTIRNAIFASVFFFSIFLFSNQALASVKVGFVDHYITIEADHSKCLDSTLRKGVLSIGENFSSFVKVLREKFPDLVDGEAEFTDWEHITKDIQKQIIEHYENGSDMEPREDSLTQYPKPRNPYQDTKWYKSVPTAVYLTFGKRLNKQQQQKTQQVKALSNAIKSKGLSTLNFGASVQVGLLFAPICQYVQDIYGNSSLGEGNLLYGWTGGPDAWVGRIKFSPIVMLYAKGGVGVGQSESGGGAGLNKLLRFRFSFGQVWGQFQSLDEIYGQLLGLSYNLGIRPSFYPSGVGVNGKLGCIVNWSREGSLGIPLCDDFIYKSFSLRPASVLASGEKRNLFTFESDFSVDFLGVVFGGRRAVETLGFLVSAPPETVESVARALGDTPLNGELSQQSTTIPIEPVVPLQETPDDPIVPPTGELSQQSTTIPIEPVVPLQETPDDPIVPPTEEGLE